MPIYEYRCDKGHRFETFQSMSEDSISSCVECGAPSQRVLSAPAIHYKGSGFYTTDYAKKGKKDSEQNSGSSGSEKSSSGSESGSGSKSSEKSTSSSGSSGSSDSSGSSGSSGSKSD